MSEHEDTGSDFGRILTLARFLGVNRAVLYALLMRAWQFLAGPVTVVLIARRFSPDDQGFYYAFASLLALNSFFELGLLNVIVNITAHEWAGMDGVPAQDSAAASASRARLRSFTRFVARWYAGIGLLFFAIVAVAGTLFLSRGEGIASDWFLPWLAAVGVAAAQLVCQPFNSILEGCSLVASVNRFMLVANAASAVALWVVIIVGGGLWAPALAGSVRLLINLRFIFAVHGKLVRDLLAPPAPGDSHMDWKTEVWPLQWRIGIQGAVSWFHYSMFVPVLFHYDGPAAAGRFGMTWQIVTVLQVAAYAWIQSRIPEMAIHAARGEHDKLDRLWRRALAAAVSVFVLLCLAFEVALIIVAQRVPDIAERLLDVQTTGVLLAGRLLFLVVIGVAAFVRAHRIEPFAPMMVAVSSTIGVLGWLSGMRFGASGQAWSILGVYTLLALPWALFIYRRTRGRHRPTQHDAPVTAPGAF